WASFSFTHDLASPTPPVVSQFSLKSDTGTSQTDLTTANLLLIGQVASSGTGTVFVQVDYMADEQPDELVPVDGSGRFHFDPPVSSYGAHTIRVRAVQSNSQTGSMLVGEWTSLTVNYEFAASTAAKIVGLALKNDTGASATDQITSDSMLTGSIVTGDE